MEIINFYYKSVMSRFFLRLPENRPLNVNLLFHEDLILQEDALLKPKKLDHRVKHDFHEIEDCM
jgi:hypothetical protein